MILPDEDEKWKQNQDPRVGFLFKPDFPEHRFYLKDGDITVGAGDKNTIVIDKPAVSWNHAIIITRNDTVRIQDSASTNGTFVNDQRLTRPRNLVHGDDVRFANVAYTVWIKPKLREIS